MQRDIGVPNLRLRSDHGDAIELPHGVCAEPVDGVCALAALKLGDCAFDVVGLVGGSDPPQVVTAVGRKVRVTN